MKDYRHLIESVFSEKIRQIDKNIISSFKIKDNLCPKIFKDEKMNNDIRDGLMKISNDFIDYCGVDFVVEDIILTGSLANYNWSKYSDVDLHIVIDYDDLKEDKKTLKELFDAKKIVWNESHNIQVKDFDVEIYVQDIKEEHTSSGIYSVLNHEWNVKPKKENPIIDEKKIMHKAEEYIDRIDSLFKLSKTQDVLPQIENIKEKLKKFRKSGLEKDGEYSYENLTFKLLRRNGYIERLINLKKKISDQKLSMKEAEIVKNPTQPEVGGPFMGTSYQYLNYMNENKQSIPCHVCKIPTRFKKQLVGGEVRSCADGHDGIYDSNLKFIRPAPQIPSEVRQQLSRLDCDVCKEPIDKINKEMKIDVKCSACNGSGYCFYEDKGEELACYGCDGEGSVKRSGAEERVCVNNHRTYYYKNKMLNALNI